MIAPADLPPVDVIVVAAGASRRMGGIDKVTAPIAGRPLLAWTLDALATVDAVDRLVVVAAPERVDELRAAPWLPSTVGDVVAGAERRQGSVAAGVRALGLTDADAQRVILVHDGARPVVPVALIESVIMAAAAHGAAIPGLPIAETVKRVDGERVAATVDRSSLVTVQTPQGVRAKLLLQAYERFPPDGPQTFTDEAALLEACRIPVHVVPGEPSNLKVTVPDDLARVAATLGGAAKAPTPGRAGIGHDSHPFGAGAPLRLGGISIAGAPRLRGHSDGDVAVHAVCDAVLGAAGLGDLGQLFPAGPETPVGIDSGEMLTDVVARAGAAGWRPASIDLTIIAARPRIGPALEAMREAIAGHAGIDPGAVNVKASTGNLSGDEGAGRSISALAVVLLEPVA